MRGLPSALTVKDAYDVLEDLVVMLHDCLDPSCACVATRWYVRTDLEDTRLVLWPVCDRHRREANAAACPSPDMCLAPGARHYLAAPMDVIDQVAGALESGYGVAVPRRDDWDTFDVWRPRAAR
jgi:hypothetical protein